MKYLRIAIISMSFSLFSFATLIPVTANALSLTPPIVADLKGDAQSGLDQVGGGGTDINSIVKAVVEILSYVVGVAAVIMIIISGFKYITSGGDSGKVGSAKSTLIYALVGLVIAVLAQALVTFALNAGVNGG